MGTLFRLGTHYSWDAFFFWKGSGPPPSESVSVDSRILLLPPYNLSFVFRTASFSELTERSLLAHSRCSREASAAPVVVDGLTSSSRSKHWCN